MVGLLIMKLGEKICVRSEEKGNCAVMYLECKKSIGIVNVMSDREESHNSD